MEHQQYLPFGCLQNSHHVHEATKSWVLQGTAGSMRLRSEFHGLVHGMSRYSSPQAEPRHGQMRHSRRPRPLQDSSCYDLRTNPHSKCHLFRRCTGGSLVILHVDISVDITSLQVLDYKGNGGEGGIRTPGTLSGTPVFKTGAINHSATSPLQRL